MASKMHVFSPQNTGRRTRTGNEEWSVLDSLSIPAHLNISWNEADRPLISIPLASSNRSEPRIVFIFALPSRDECNPFFFDLSDSATVSAIFRLLEEGKNKQRWELGEFLLDYWIGEIIDVSWIRKNKILLMNLLIFCSRWLITNLKGNCE